MPFPLIPENAADLQAGYDLAHGTLGDGGTKVEKAGGLIYLTCWEFRWTFPEAFVAQLDDGALKTLLEEG